MTESTKFVVILPMVLMTVFSGTVFMNVLAGKIGNGETWRLFAGFAGFAIIFSLSLFFTFRIMKGNGAPIAIDE